mgnify:CR=1 FL=1
MKDVGLQIGSVKTNSLGMGQASFGGDVVDGRLYGRGSCDMKAGIASAVFAAEAIRRAGAEIIITYYARDAARLLRGTDRAR